MILLRILCILYSIIYIIHYILCIFPNTYFTSHFENLCICEMCKVVLKILSFLHKIFHLHVARECKYSTNKSLILHDIRVIVSSFKSLGKNKKFIYVLYFRSNFAEAFIFVCFFCCQTTLMEKLAFRQRSFISDFQLHNYVVDLTTRI